MSDLKVSPGQPIQASKWNQLVDRLPDDNQTSGQRPRFRLVLVRTLEEIAAATIDETDTADSIYNAGEVDTYGLINQGDGTFATAITTQKRLMINASQQVMPVGTELWAMDHADGVLISTVWVC